MGLDSVYLLMALEKKFKKEIPDREAENIDTILDMANWFFNNLPIKQPDKEIKSHILGRIKNVFAELGWADTIGYEQIIGDFIPKENRIHHWNNVEARLHLKIPALQTQDLTGKKRKGTKIVGLIISKTPTPILDMPFDRFIECIGALNYEEFVDFDHLTSLFEITIAIMGITQEETRINIAEITLNSSFAHDLGID